MHINRYIESVFSRPKVQKQLVTIFVSVLFIPIAVCIFLLYQSTHSLNQHYLEQAEAENQRVKSIMFDVTTNIHNISEDLIADKELAELLYREYETDEEAKQACSQYHTIYNILYRDTSISSLSIYTLNESIGEHSYFHTITPEIKKQEWFLNASQNASGFWLTQNRIDDRGNLYWELTYYRRIPLVKNGTYAILVLAVSDNYLKNRIDNTTLKSMITVNQELIFYSTEKKYLGTSLPVYINYEKGYYRNSGIMDFSDTKAMVSISTLVPMNSTDNMYLVSYNPQAISDVHEVTRNYILIILATTLLPCILFFIYSKYFSGRVLMLRKAMHQASRGNYDIMDSFTGNDEISETFQDLRIMIEEIKKKEADIYEAQLRAQEIQSRQQQMEFKVLASQINPHFLYNTLETIRMKAFTSGDREVATAIKLLGKSLRYVLENTGTVSIPLSKELSYIQTYISIQKLRFGERIHFETEIQETLVLDEYKILPLMLQPIVENSISHGLDGMDSGGKILLEIFEEETDLIIRISDNGKGMTKEELESFMQRMTDHDETRTRSIGLSNINHRLSLCYGSDCQLHMESALNCGTCTILKLPLSKIKENPENESSYRR